MNSPTSITGGGLMSDVIAADGYGQHEIIRDGKIHRFTHPDDKPGSNNCWYVSFGTAGAFGSWKLGFSRTWSDGKSENNAALLEEIREYQRQRAADMEIIRQDAARGARNLWDSASTSIDHPYPVKKQIKPYGARQLNNTLLIPMYYRGELVNLQRIFADGKKRFMRGGRVVGAYMPIGTISDHIFIAEGYATSASLFERTGTAIAVAFNCGNLKPVALSIRKKYPDLNITIACDNDTGTPGNPGLTKGRAAAAVVGGDVLWPDFSDEEFDGSDFNDFLTQGGEL